MLGDPDALRLLGLIKDSTLTIGGLIFFFRISSFLSRFEFAIELMWQDYCHRNNHKYVPLRKSKALGLG